MLSITHTGIANAAAHSQIENHTQQPDLIPSMKQRQSSAVAAFNMPPPNDTSLAVGSGGASLCSTAFFDEPTSAR